MKRKSEKKIIRDTLHALSPHASRFTRYASRIWASASRFRFTLHASRSSPGFTLLAMVGILAIMTILAAVFAPSLVAVKDRQATDDELNNLRGIADGTALYLRRNRAWAPNLAAHSPLYVPLDGAQLLENPRGFPRYYSAHPTTASFNNGLGLAASDLTALRFLLVSDLSQDAAPTITNVGEFETWWATDETATPDLKIYRGNLATMFHNVNLTFTGEGGSYQIDSTVTDSNGLQLTDYNRYHAVGTVVSLDEADVFGTPEIQFALTANVTYEFDPCRPIGSQWALVPATPGTCAAWTLWFTTQNDTNGMPTIGGWGDEEIIAFEQPQLSYENSPVVGTTDGTYRSVFNLENFTASADIDAIHYVSRNISVGSTTPMDLYVGDLLISSNEDETLTSTNSLSVADDDVFVFRPDYLGNYTSGTFLMFFDESDVSGLGPVEGISLVEEDTLVGDTILTAGTILFTERNEDVYLFTPTNMGENTAGTFQDLIEGNDLNISTIITGIELLEGNTTLEIGTTLSTGQILLTLFEDTSGVGDNALDTVEEDIFVLDMKTTTLGDTGISSADVSYLFDGSDVALGAFDIHGFTLSPQLKVLPFVNPDFETGDLTGWTKTGDLLDAGGINQFDANDDPPNIPIGAHAGTYLADGSALGPTGSGEHLMGIYQRVDISEYATDIDEGEIAVALKSFGRGETNQDHARMRVLFYDAVSGGNQVGSHIDSNMATLSNEWEVLFISTAVPPTARSFELLLLGAKWSGGTYTDAGFDDISGILLVAP